MPLERNGHYVPFLKVFEAANLSTVRSQVEACARTLSSRYCSRRAASTQEALACSADKAIPRCWNDYDKYWRVLAIEMQPHAHLSVAG